MKTVLWIQNSIHQNKTGRVKKRRMGVKKVDHGGLGKLVGGSSDCDSSEKPPPLPGLRKNSSKVTQLPVQLCPLMILIFICSGNLNLCLSSPSLLAFTMECPVEWHLENLLILSSCSSFSVFVMLCFPCWNHQSGDLHRHHHCRPHRPQCQY